MGSSTHASVCMLRAYVWSEDMKKLHLRGDHADWLQKPSMAWQLLSEESYSSRAPLIPREELQAFQKYANKKALIKIT